MATRRQILRRIGGLIPLLGIALIGLAACSGQGASQARDVVTAPEIASEVDSAPASQPGDPSKRLEPDSERAAVDVEEPKIAPQSDGQTPATAAPKAEDTAQEEPDQAASPVETEPRLFVPSDRPLEATDPSTVDLASGQIQLFEFFAFW